MTIRSFRITTQCADPRRFFACLEHGSLVFHLVVLHAPCLSKNKGYGTRPIDAIAGWWKETARLFTDHITSDLVWVFVDANAPINQEFSPHAGAAGSEEPTRKVLGEFLQALTLFVPSTFEHFHHGPHATWTLQRLQVPQGLYSHQ